MDLQGYRDLIICITAPVIAISLVVIAVISCLRYLRTKRIADSLDAAASKVNEIISDVREDIIDPALQMMSLFRGIRQGMELINRFMKKEGE